MFVCSVMLISVLDTQSKFQMLTLFPGRHVGVPQTNTNMAAPYQANVREIFRRISQLWDNAHTLNLENCPLYLSSIISLFLDFIHLMVFDFIFIA